jgi:hypothetical protein
VHPAAAPAAWHYFDRGTDTDVIMIGRGPGRRVAVLFFHRDFPKARFGHRFFLEPCAEDYEKIWLKEDIDTGALHHMMRNQPTADSAGIIWTTWGNPDPGQEGEPGRTPVTGHSRATASRAGIPSQGKTGCHDHGRVSPRAWRAKSETPRSRW